MIHRFEIELADVDRSVYEALDLRVARHPSEDVPYLLTRVLAYALEYEPGLAFTKGLGDGEEPAIVHRDDHGSVRTWIDVGLPTPERLHRASKLAGRVVVYAHRRPEPLLQRCAKERIHRGEEIRLVRVPAELLAALEAKLDRNNRWSLTVHDGRVTIVCDGTAIEDVFRSQALVAPA
jgi:uncharacterized protein YaeQ